MIEDMLFSTATCHLRSRQEMDEILLLQMDGGMTREQLKKALKMAIEKGTEDSAFKRQH